MFCCNDGRHRNTHCILLTKCLKILNKLCTVTSHHPQSKCHATFNAAAAAPDKNNHGNMLHCMDVPKTMVVLRVHDVRACCLLHLDFPDATNLYTTNASSRTLGRWLKQYRLSNRVCTECRITANQTVTEPIRHHRCRGRVVASVYPPALSLTGFKTENYRHCCTRRFCGNIKHHAEIINDIFDIFGWIAPMNVLQEFKKMA